MKRFLLFLAALAGCQTPHEFSEPADTWVTRHGQLRYSDGSSSVIGEVVVSHVPVRDFQLDYMAGPGFPLVQLREDHVRARAVGSLARGQWEGRPHTAPDHLTSWFLLHEVFNKLAARRWSESPTTFDSLTPGIWHATVEGRHGKPEKVSVTFPETGERFQFVFQVTN